eukprot:jgi/Bigna1/72559/fgenesh1_pg.20_\
MAEKAPNANPTLDGPSMKKGVDSIVSAVDTKRRSKQKAPRSGRGDRLNSPTSRPRTRSKERLMKKKEGQLTLTRQDFMSQEEKFLEAELAKWSALNIGLKRLEKYDKKLQSWHARNNVTLFQAAAVKYGVDRLDVLTPEDLERGNVQNDQFLRMRILEHDDDDVHNAVMLETIMQLKNVQNCLLAVARIATIYGIAIPELLEDELNKRGIGVSSLEGKKITLSDINDTFVGCRDPDSVRMENKQTETEQFTIVVNKEEQKVAFQTKTSENNYLDAGRLHRGFIVIKASNDKFLGVTSEGGVDAQEKVLEKCLFRLRIATKTKKKKKKKEDSKRQSEPVTEQPSGLESAAGMLDDVEYPLTQSTLLESGKQQGELLEGGEGGKAVTDSLLGNRKYCCCCNCCYLNFGMSYIRKYSAAQ